MLEFAATLVGATATAGEFPASIVRAPVCATLILPVQSETWNNPRAGVVTCIGPCIFVPTELSAKAST